MTLVQGINPISNLSGRDVISDEEADRFRANGFLIIRNVLAPCELSLLRRETGILVQRALAPTSTDLIGIDCVYRTHEITGRTVPSRIEYVVDKSRACRALLGHPVVLRTVEKLQGKSFIPTWDSMVFKSPGEGAQIAWHRDADCKCVGTAPIFNVDFYLDRSDITNCLWVIPGSHSWSDEKASLRIAELSTPPFHTTGAVAVCLKPGDILLHNILLLHGSPASLSPLRRVIYYEFRPAETELTLGPHQPSYIPAKQRVLWACINERRQAPYAANEKPFQYEPCLRKAAPPKTPLDTYRYPHSDFM